MQEARRLGAKMRTRIFRWREKDGYLASLILSHEKPRETVEVVPEPLPPKRKLFRVSADVVRVVRPYILMS